MYLFKKNSLGVFPCRLTMSLASFAKKVSSSDNVLAMAYCTIHLIRYPPVSLKAGYAVHSTYSTA